RPRRLRLGLLPLRGSRVEDRGPRAAGRRPGRAGGAHSFPGTAPGSEVGRDRPDPRRHPGPCPRSSVPGPRSSQSPGQPVAGVWDEEVRSARRKLEPEGALTGATRELQAGLGAFLQVCHEHGVKVGPWRLHHVVGEWAFGEHPTYGVMTIAHWVCKDGQPWK